MMHSDNENLVNEIIKLKKHHKACIVAHTYQPSEIQDIADYVGDSYGLSVKATEQTDEDTIIFCGVRFMAETAALLNPQKRVILPIPDAGCPMADMITPHELKELKTAYPEHVVVCYVNSTVEIKALSDICCTSSNAVAIVEKIPTEKGIIFIPDKNLGSWVQEKTLRAMVIWDGFCPTHELITIEMLTRARLKYPNCRILIHPEASKECRDYADAVLSTGGMCDYVKNHTYDLYCIATELGILHTLAKQNPDKKFYAVTDEALCPNMKKTTLQSIYFALTGSGGAAISIQEDIAMPARRALQKMLLYSK